MSQPITIFNHVPKCAGTTALRCLGEWFELVRDYPGKPDDESTEKFLANPPDVSLLKPGCLLAGHYHYPGGRLSDRIPGVYDPDSLYRLITFIRDPYERKLSHWRFGRRIEFFPESLDFSTYLEEEPNFIAHALECDESNYKERLSSYFFIGFQESFQEDLDRLADRLGKTRYDASGKSKLIAPQDEVKPEITDEERSRFEARNALDYRVCEFVKSLREPENSSGT